jgi:hypothetical protein
MQDNKMAQQPAESKKKAKKGKNGKGDAPEAKPILEQDEPPKLQSKLHCLTPAIVIVTSSDQLNETGSHLSIAITMALHFLCRW